jgi:hypothetical protein
VELNDIKKGLKFQADPYNNEVVCCGCGRKGEEGRERDGVGVG